MTIGQNHTICRQCVVTALLSIDDIIKTYRNDSLNCDSFLYLIVKENRGAIWRYQMKRSFQYHFIQLMKSFVCYGCVERYDASGDLKRKD